MQGKAKLPKIEMEFRNTARSILKNKEMESEYKTLLSLPDKSSSSYNDVKEVSDIRMEKALEVKDVLDELVSAKNKERKESLKAAQKRLMQEFVSLPDLGCTFDEWVEAVDSGLIKTSAGRPPIPLEVNLLRSKELADKAMKSYRSLSEKLGCPESIEDSSFRHPIPEDDMLKLYAKITENMGKEANGELGILDSEIRKLDEKIHYIESGEAQRDQDYKLRNAKYSSNGTRLGRPFEPLDQVLSRLRDERSALEGRRERLDSELPVIDQMARRIKTEEDKLRDLRRVIRSKGWDPRKDDRANMPYGDILTEVEAVVAKLKAMKADAESKSQEAARKKVERATQKKEILQSEIDAQHQRDEAIRKNMDSKKDLQEGIDQLIREVGSI